MTEETAIICPICGQSTFSFAWDEFSEDSLALARHCFCEHDMSFFPVQDLNQWIEEGVLNERVLEKYALKLIANI